MAQKFLQQESKKACPFFREIKGTNLLVKQGSRKEKKLKSGGHVKVLAKTCLFYT